MKKVLLSVTVAAFGAMTSVALADSPTKLTYTQLDQLTAGASGKVDNGVRVAALSTKPNDSGATFTGQKKKVGN
jgi:hypothetical protein